MSVLADIDQAMAIMEVAFEPYWGEAWNRRQLENTLSMPGSFLFLVDAAGDEAGQEDEAVGFILSRLTLDEEELLLIGVKPEFRRRGIGRSMLTAFADQARNRGAAKVFLEMRANNPAESLYRNSGFEPIGRRRDYYKTSEGSRVDAITFAKKL